MKDSIAEVAVPRPLDRTFDYLVPEAFAGIPTGVRVRVPFGTEPVVGYLLRRKAKTDFRGKLQPILACLDEEPMFSPAHLQLAAWISDCYLCPLGLVLQAMVPQGLACAKPSRTKVVQLALSLTETLLAIERLRKSAPQQAVLLQRLLNTLGPTAADLLKAVGCSNGPLQQLQKKGLVQLRTEPRRPFQSAMQEVAAVPELTLHQQQALAKVTDALARGRGSFLLHGVNGSGKTEVYLQAVRCATSMGKTALLLVPEISLTPQLTARARMRLGHALAVIHSGMTEAQRSAEWERLRQGQAQVLLGVRMASLLPMQRLGLIVLDEEHEPTYKQDAPEPRYHAREVALQRARVEGAVVILGSATPALESFWRAQQGQLQRLALPHRVVSAQAPQIEVVDMQPHEQGWSDHLHRALEEALDDRGQAILFLNRRGFGSAWCKRCRRVQRCPQCAIALVYHLRPQQLRCRYCNYVQKNLKCPGCGGELQSHGQGTQQVELLVRRRFPHARLERMDSDAVKRGQHGVMLERFRQGQFDILLGTQMIGLGHDFPNVQLVGILDADGLLNVPDFRAAERTFQLICQAAGRAGRGSKRGRVILQTHYPEHYAIQRASRLDYEGFAHSELALRKEHAYPPFAHLIRLEIAHPDQARCWEVADAIKDALCEFQVLGPAPASPPRWRGHWLAQLVVKSSEMQAAQSVLKHQLQRLDVQRLVRLDVDPYGS